MPSKIKKMHLQNEKAMCNFANEITKSNIINKLDKNIFSDPNFNYNILIEEMDMANVKHMPYKIVTFNKCKHKKISVDNQRYT